MSETPTNSTSTPRYGEVPSYPQYLVAPQYPAVPQPGSGRAAVADGAVPPPPNAGWAVAAVIFFWPLAFAAFNHVHDVYPKWAIGDYQGARYASDRAKQLGKIALWIFAGLLALFIVGYSILIAILVSSVNELDSSTSGL